MLMIVRIRNHRHASVVADSCLLHFRKLPHFGVRSIQRLELLDAARPHAGLIERAVIGEQMLVASEEPQKQNRQRDELVLHNSILSGARAAARKCAVRGTRRRDRGENTVPSSQSSVFSSVHEPMQPTNSRFHGMHNLGFGADNQI